MNETLRRRSAPLRNSRAAAYIFGRILATELSLDVPILDARGLKCPLPVLKARKALQSVAPGGQLRVLATDPGAVGDLQALCDAAGHTLVGWAEADQVFTFDLQKKVD